MSKYRKKNVFLKSLKPEMSTSEIKIFRKRTRLRGLKIKHSCLSNLGNFINFYDAVSNIYKFIRKFLFSTGSVLIITYQFNLFI